MSVDYGAAGVAEPTGGSSDGPGTPTAAKREAAEVKDVAVDAAKDVAATAKDEAASVARETKVQLQDLYDRSRQELSGQAAQQQRRLASGLQSVGDDLASMARSAETGGVAADLVQRASQRLSGAGTWLDERDPQAVMREVKSFARRRPGVFILGAVVAGVVVGRLTRALAAGAKDAGQNDSTSSGARSVSATGVDVNAVPVSDPGAGSYPTAADSTVTGAPSQPDVDVEPLYGELAGRAATGGGEASDERRDSF